MEIILIYMVLGLIFYFWENKR